MRRMKVLVLKGDSYELVGQMFGLNGYDVVYHNGSLPKVDLVCFTGGADVSPHLYGEENEGLSHCDPIRDQLEKEIYEHYLAEGTPMVGICRGGQFLAVMNGAKMIQDIGHRHGVVKDYHRREFMVDHHQCIDVPIGHSYIVISVADINNTTVDYAGYFPDTQCLIFQPHPEWGHVPTEKFFFKMIEEYI